jgi:hypothetical protein
MAVTPAIKITWFVHHYLYQIDALTLLQFVELPTLKVAKPNTVARTASIASPILP